LIFTTKLKGHADVVVVVVVVALVVAFHFEVKTEEPIAN